MDTMETDHQDPDCDHIWRVFGMEDRCVLCGADRPHPIAGPYAWDRG